MRHSGQALVPVLFVVLILTALAVTVSQTSRREVRAAGGHLRDVQAYYIAHGAIQYVAAQMEEATNGGATYPQLTLPPDTDANGWTQLGDGWYKVDIVDTSSRLNINTASAASLAKLPPFQSDPNIAAAIVDWRDADDTPTTGQDMVGAESDYYQTLNPPYNAKNAPFDTIDELLLVRGITPDMLYGPGGNGDPNATSQPSLTGTTSRASRQTPSGGTTTGQTGQSIDTSASTTPLSELVTTYSRERNVAADGTPRVNIKTASASDLQSKLGIGGGLARQFVQARNAGQITINSIADLLNVPGVTRNIMQQFADKITVTDDQYRNGVININTAPAEVLAAIPNVDSTIYNAVIQWRQSGNTFTGLNDLFQLTSLNRQQLQTLVDHVCTKSSTYLLRVRVRLPGSQKVYAAEALAELQPGQQAASAGQTAGSGSGTGGASTASTSSSGTAAILQWREVGRSPGWSSWVAAPNYYTTSGGFGGTS